MKTGMRNLIMAVGCLMLASCAVESDDAPAVSVFESDICTYDADSGTWQGDCGNQQGGGGGGGTINFCALNSCDPLIATSDVTCTLQCGRLAQCFHSYRCGDDWSCPEAHIGYCN